VRNATFRPILCAAAALVLLSSAALAQAPPQPKVAPDQNAPAHFDNQANAPGAQNKTLSERLDQTNGVIKPPAHVDPEIHESPPPTGDNNVIPPPANPAVQAK
jgi:hypothetical protein